MLPPFLKGSPGSRSSHQCCLFGAATMTCGTSWALLYKESQGSGQVDRVLLLGTPGIGKTVSMNYFLHRALNVGYKVLFETREERFYFHDGVVESELLEGRVLSNIHGDPAVFFLVDHQQNQPPPFVKSFTVAAMSPDQRNYKEFVKNRCKVYFVPLPLRARLLR